MSWTLRLSGILYGIDMEGPIEREDGSPVVRCECGAHKTSNKNCHSDWCPAHPDNFWDVLDKECDKGGARVKFTKRKE